MGGWPWMTHTMPHSDPRKFLRKLGGTPLRPGGSSPRAARPRLVGVDHLGY